MEGRRIGGASGGNVVIGEGEEINPAFIGIDTVNFTLIKDFIANSGVENFIECLRVNFLDSAAGLRPDDGIGIVEKIFLAILNGTSLREDADNVNAVSKVIGFDIVDLIIFESFGSPLIGEGGFNFGGNFGGDVTGFFQNGNRIGVEVLTVFVIGIEPKPILGVCGLTVE